MNSVRTNNIGCLLLAGCLTSLYLLPFRQAYSAELKAAQANDRTLKMVQNSFSFPTKSAEIINILAPYWKFLSESITLPTNERARRFREMVIDPNRTIYDAAFPSGTAEISDASLDHYLERIAPYAPAMHKVADQIASHAVQSERQFAREFPDMFDYAIYVMPSLLDFNGKTGHVGARHALFLGVDWLALNEDSNLDVLISHELFHAYQSETNPQAFAEYVSNIDKAPLYKTLWTEGLATYVSRTFNPKAPLGEILMDKNLAARAPGCLNSAARELKEKLDSTSATDRKKFFAYRPPEADQTSAEPSRIGYFVGMKVAEELARKYSLLDLAHLHGAELEHEIGAALQRITERNTPDS